MGKGGKRVKSCGKVYPSLYIEYIIKEYIRVNKGKVRKWRERERMCGKECFPYIVYNSIIEIRKRKRWKRGGTKVCSLYIYRTLILIRKHKGVLSANIRSIYKTYVQMCTCFPHVCVYFQLNI